MGVVFFIPDIITPPPKKKKVSTTTQATPKKVTIKGLIGPHMLFHEKICSIFVVTLLKIHVSYFTSKNYLISLLNI